MTDYLNSKFDWTDPEVVSAFDELSLWSAMAGLLLLDHVPIQRGIRVLDVGCGSGFPLLEFADRLGSGSTVTGVDIAETALSRARQKARARGIKNIEEIVLADAIALPFDNGRFDLIVSNLGINNFTDPVRVLRECYRVAKSGAVIALTTNLVGHMGEFYDLFRQTLHKMGLQQIVPRLETHIAHRATIDGTKTALRDAGFSFDEVKTTTVSLAYADGSAMLRHSFVRAAFLPAWIEVLKDCDVPAIFQQLEKELNKRAEELGELFLRVPLAYFEAHKPG
jgi:arsenite methyltransferase